MKIHKFATVTFHIVKKSNFFSNKHYLQELHQCYEVVAVTAEIQKKDKMFHISREMAAVFRKYFRSRGTGIARDRPAGREGLSIDLMLAGPAVWVNSGS